MHDLSSESVAVAPEALMQRGTSVSISVIKVVMNFGTSPKEAFSFELLDPKTVVLRDTLNHVPMLVEGQ